MPKKEDLKPTQKQLVADIVDGLHLEMTSQYDWCFGDPNDVGVMFVWYKSLREAADGTIYFTDRTSDWIDENRDTALSVQKNRAQAVGDMILKAYWNGRPIRVGIVDGTTKKVGNRETSEAQFRELDDLQWYPHHRDPVTQQIVVMRGVPQPLGFNAYEEDHSTNSKGIVTGDAEERPIIPNSKATVYERDSQVVRDAKRRAADGRCEYC